MTSSQHIHTLVALNMPRTHAAAIIFARHVFECLTGNARLPAPSPPLAQFGAHIQAYEAAEVTAKSHATGDAAVAHAAYDQVLTDLHQIVSYVQSVADGAPSDALAIIASSGFGTRPHGVHAKAHLEATMAVGGVVVLHALAVAKHAAYEWQISSDGGKTFTALPATTTATTHVSGLTVGQLYNFRVRGNVGETVGDWYDPAPLVVH